MNNNLERHKRSDKAKWAFTAIAFILVFVMLGGLIAAVVTETNPADWIQALKDRTETEGETPEGETTDDGGLTVTVDEESNAEAVENNQGVILEKVNLSSSGVEIVEGKYKQGIIATVLPEDAPDRTLSWSVVWGDNPKSDDVTNYVYVDVYSSNTLSVNIYCIKAFEGSTIKVIATSNAVPISATCTCIYEGKPVETYSYFLNGETMYETGKTEGHQILADEYTFNLVLANPLGLASSKYSSFEIESVSMKGKFYINKQYINNGTIQFESEDLVDLSGYSAPCGYYAWTGWDSEPLEETLTEIKFTDFIEYSLSGNVLSVKIKGDESTYSLGANSRIGNRVTYSRAYVDPRSGGVADNAIFCISVRETVSGAIISLYIDPINNVSSVSLSYESVEF